MNQKPEIQYIGQFYVHGSEARKLETPQPRKSRTILPRARLEKIEKIYVDPVALVGIVTAVVMLITMVVGALQLKQDWADYKLVSGYVSQLKQENAQLRKSYRESYDLEDIRKKAIGLGLVEKDELETMEVIVTVPVRAQEPTAWENFQWFVKGLLE